MIPLSLSLGFGVLFATGISLLLIPSLYLIVEDARGWLTSWRRRRRADPTRHASASATTRP
jgi:hypothetical protein